MYNYVDWMMLRIRLLVMCMVWHFIIGPIQTFIAKTPLQSRARLQAQTVVMYFVT